MTRQSRPQQARELRNLWFRGSLRSLAFGSLAFGLSAFAYSSQVLGAPVFPPIKAALSWRQHSRPLRYDGISRAISRGKSVFSPASPNSRFSSSGTKPINAALSRLAGRDKAIIIVRNARHFQLSPLVHGALIFSRSKLSRSSSSQANRFYPKPIAWLSSSGD